MTRLAPRASLKNPPFKAMPRNLPAFACALFVAASLAGTGLYVMAASLERPKIDPVR